MPAEVVCTFLVLALLLALSIMLSRKSPLPRRLVLAWEDEFDGPAGALPDQSKWTHEIGGHGWGNNELQTYTNRADNACLDGKSNLVITACKETLTGPDGIRRDYTSARLITKGKFAQKYGRFEARIKVPVGQGIWPAAWMLGDNIDEVGWPECGEADIMENPGFEPSTNHGSLHGPGYCAGESLTGVVTLPDGQKLCDDFHVYGLEWDEKEVRFYLDGKIYHTKSPADTRGNKWVFDHPMFLLLNVAVGGIWPGSPDESTSFPKEMLVDWVRVYKWID